MRYRKLDPQKLAKLTRYLKNSDRFMWRLAPGNNQKEAYPALHRQGFQFKDGSYDDVLRQLLVDPGIEDILKGIIVPAVQKTFSRDCLDYLRNCWHAGTKPDPRLLQRLGDVAPFVVINPQYQYVERWTDLAGLWFEEIEPELKTSK